MPTFNFFIDPVSAPRQVRSHLWKPSKGVLKYRNLRDEIRRQAYAGNFWKLPEELIVIFCLPMPSSWSYKKQQICLQQKHQQKPDIDNLLKAFMDAFGEDAYVFSINAKKIWGYTGLIQVEIP